MGKFEKLTKYLSQLDGEKFSAWIIDRGNDGTPGHSIQMPFVNYSVLAHHFIDDVYEYVDTHKDLELNRYGDIKKRTVLNGVKSLCLRMIFHS